MHKKCKIDRRIDMETDIVAIRERKMRDLMSEVEKARDAASWPGEPIEVNDSNFESSIQRYNAVVVDCWAPWCGPCRMITPTIEALAKEYKGRVAFGKLNTDQSIATAGKFGIMSIPTLLFFKNGELVDRMIGAAPREIIEERLRKIL